VRGELGRRLEEIVAAGVDEDRVVLDPGLGFAKLAHHNWELLRGLHSLAELGRPLLVGASRKTFLGRLLEGPDGEPRPVDDREAAGVALTALLAAGMGGVPVWCVRVHDVRANRDALRVVEQFGGGDDD
jgi:dihydropteroate synthase